MAGSGSETVSRTSGAHAVRVRRRDFLATMAASLAGLGLSPSIAVAGQSAQVAADRGALLDAYFGAGGLESAALVGAFYLGTFDAPDGVVAALEPTNGLIAGQPDDELALDLLTSRVTADFEEERIFTLEGWTLAITELNLCALVAARTER